MRGLQFLGWMENLDHDEGEVPPRSIWFNEDALDEHFEAVKRRRKDKYGGDGDEGKGIEDAVQNPAARGLVGG